MLQLNLAIPQRATRPPAALQRVPPRALSGLRLGVASQSGSAVHTLHPGEGSLDLRMIPKLGSSPQVS